MAIFSNGAFKPYKTYNITAGTSPVSTPAFEHIGGVIRIAAMTDIYVAVGLNPVATKESMIIPKGKVEYLIAKENEKLSVLQVSQSGIVSVSEIQ